MSVGDEVLIAISLIALAIGLFVEDIYFKNKIEKLENTVTNLDSYINNYSRPANQNIRHLVTDEIVNKKDDTSTNSKAGYGHVFNLTRASTYPLDEQQITVHTIDDLKTIWDKYGHHTDKCFEDNCLIINFDKNRIIIYDDWVK